MVGRSVGQSVSQYVSPLALTSSPFRDSWLYFGCQSQTYFTTDGRSVSQSVCQSVPLDVELLQDSWPDFVCGQDNCFWGGGIVGRSLFREEGSVM